MSKDIVGKNQVSLEFDDELSIAEFRQRLTKHFPNLEQMPTYSIALNEEYAEETQLLSNNDILAIIPPVSGG
jgi:molybdopterin synthase sulfur carrier subunit